MPSPAPITPTPWPEESFSDAEAAVQRLQEIYERNVAFLRDQFAAYAGGRLPDGRVRACYPCVRVVTYTHARIDSRSSYGFVAGPGSFAASITRPDLFRGYLHEQITLLIAHHDVPVAIGESDEPIPIHFAYDQDANLAADLQQGHLPEHPPLRDLFDTPNLRYIDDAIVDWDEAREAEDPEPLALFRAARVDYSLHRLQHYTGTSAEHFQNYVLFTNYPFYTEAFADMARQKLAAGEPDCQALVEPGDRVTRPGEQGSAGAAPTRLPQMPAYHWVQPDNEGVTMINIGTGPSNARNASDHVAVLRPHAWLMLGHCAGLRNTQRLGDYVLAHGYVREDRVLDDELPTWVPLPPLAEIQLALEDAGRAITGLDDYELKRLMRTGTVASMDNRNWELSDHATVMQRLSRSRAVALDMESAAIAANGFRYRVPYGTLLCVSDKPLHGEIKLARMAGAFYSQRVEQHLQIGLHALEQLKGYERYRLHSRKLRSLAEVAFR